MSSVHASLELFRKMNKKLVFGLGSGRCGTHSLSKLLNKQTDFDVSHELGDNPVLTWDFNNECLDFYLSKILSRSSTFVGDVAFYLINYVDYILDKYPDSKFICLKRDKFNTVTSYDKKTFGRNHWQSHSGNYYRLCPWDRCYPKYTQEIKKEEAIALYYDNYYSLIEELINKYPKNVSLFNMEDLNDYEKVKSMLDFIGVEESNMNIKTNINEQARNN